MKNYCEPTMNQMGYHTYINVTFHVGGSLKCNKIHSFLLKSCEKNYSESCEVACEMSISCIKQA